MFQFKNMLAITAIGAFFVAFVTNFGLAPVMAVLVFIPLSLLLARSWLPIWVDAGQDG